MEWFTSIVEVLPKLRSKLLLSGLIVAVAAIIAMREVVPQAVNAQISAGAVGVLFIVFGQVFSSLKDIPEQDRTKLLTSLFITFCVFVVALVIVTGVFVSRVSDNPPDKSKSSNSSSSSKSRDGNPPSKDDGVIKPPDTKTPDSSTPALVAAPAQTWHAEDKDGRPYMVSWQFPANCNGKYGLLRVDDTHRCDIEPTRINEPNDNTPFDTWSLWIDAPQGALVYDVTCEPRGQNIIKTRGIYQGQTGMCTGEINGGIGPILMTIKWKQLW